MIKRMMMLVVALFTVACASDGPILVGQGTGESEYSLAFARANLPDLLKTCLGTCELNSAQRALLEDLIRRSHAAPVAKFWISGDKHVFSISGDQRRVFFNHPLLWMDVEKTVAYSIPYAVTVWIDVLLRIENPHANDFVNITQVKNELMTALNQKIVRVASAFGEKNPFDAMTWKGAGGDRLYVRNEAFVNFELTAMVKLSLECERAENLAIHSVRFSEMRENDDGSLSVRMETVQTWTCGEETRRGRSKIVFDSTKPDGNGHYFVRLETIRVFMEGE